MSLDEKLKGWAEATEALEPSDELLAKLGSLVDAPTPPPAGPSTVATVVKVLIITALVGAVGYAVMRSQEVAWGWFASSTPVVARVNAGLSRGDAGLPMEDAGLPGAEVCGPEPSAMAIAIPKSPQDFEADRKSLRRQLISRPLTCVAQRNGLEKLLQLGGSDTEQMRWSARLGFLCGPSVLSRWLVSRADPVPCDDTDWCRRPVCDLDTEACALRWAARPATTCTHSVGLRAALSFACVRFLRGEGTEAQVRELSKDAWCLNPEALKERDELNKRNAPKESP